jgi:beta-glucosidase
VRYEEGIFVGYRHYDRLGLTPLFPFGFGLGYASFAVSDLTIDDAEFEAGGNVMVGVTITNTSDRDGAAVLQLYVSDDAASDPRPAKELKAFRKVKLKAGEQRQVTLALDARAFAYYRAKARHWLVEDGSFTLRVGLSSDDLPLTGTVTRTTTLMLPV